MSHEQERELFRLAHYAAALFLKQRHQDWCRRNREDVHAQALLLAWVYCQKYDPARGVKRSTYLVRYINFGLQHYIRDDLRHNPPAVSLDAPLDETGLGCLVDPQDVEQEVTDREERLWAQEFVVRHAPQMSRSECRALAGMYGEGLTMAEVARRSGISHAAVDKAHKRGVARLRALLDPSAAQREGER
jgi:RNA polymerase sigma factor (sigma-70 family)